MTAAAPVIADAAPGARRTAVTRRRLALAITAGVTSAACAVGLIATAAWLIGTAAGRPPIVTLSLAIVTVRACGIGRGVLRYVERLAGHDAALGRLGDQRADLYAELDRLAPAGLPELRSGDLISRVVHDVDAGADRTVALRLPYTIGVVLSVLAVIGLGWLFPPVALVLGIALVVALAIVPAVATRVSARAQAGIAAAKGHYAAAVTQALYGASDLVAFGADTAAAQRLAAADDELTAVQRRAAFGQGLATALSLAATGVALVVTLRLGVPAVRSGSLSLALLAVVVLTPLAIADIVVPLAPAATQRPRFRAAAERLADIARRPSPVAEPAAQAAGSAAEAAKAAGTAAESVAGPRGTTLLVDGITASWPGGPPVLTGVSFEAPPGGRVAVVGRSGSGKSTLAAILLRFLDPVAGQVRIGGIDTRTLTGDAVRTLVGVCAQDAYIFDSTVAENVRLARPDASDSEVLDVLGRAGLGEWLATLPDGAHTAVGEHGARLSGGQRQRVALARVLLADQPIVIFDEPTEHLDEAGAVAVTRELLDRTAGRTVVLLTHRPHGLSEMDQIIHLQ